MTCEPGMAVGARQTGLNIPETAALLGFSHTTVIPVTTCYNHNEQKHISEWATC